MLDDKDVQKLVSILATKEDVKEMKQDITDLRELVQGLIVSTDNLVKSISDLGTEYVAISNQLTRHEKWIKQIAEKMGMRLVVE